MDALEAFLDILIALCQLVEGSHELLDVQLTV
jgi:hypothetical protein